MRFSAFLSVLWIFIAISAQSSQVQETKPTPAVQSDRPIRALLVTGGCCHDYDRQKLILTRGISARANVRWTVVHQGGTSTDTKIPLYDDPNWADRDKFPKSFVIDQLKCIYCGMCEEACPVDSIELTHIYDLTGMTREEMMFDKEKLLSVFDQTKDSGVDPIRTHKGKLGDASDFTDLQTLGPATSVRGDDRSAGATSSGVISNS